MHHGELAAVDNDDLLSVQNAGGAGMGLLGSSRENEIGVAFGITCLAEFISRTPWTVWLYSLSHLVRTR